MPIDPSFLPFATDRRFQTRRPPADLSLDRMRAAADAAMIEATPPPVFAAEDRNLSVSAGTLAFRIYRPHPGERLPFVVFAHGGGFVWGSIDTHDGLCRRLCRETGAAVVSVGYRLAPENRFPVPVRDVHSVLAHLCDHADGFGLDHERFALCGDSAGANLVIAATALAQAERRAPRHLGLIYPAVDPTCASASQDEFAAGPILTRDAMRWFWECYLGAGPLDPSAIHAPLAADLSGFPPTTIATAEHDPLRDEGEALADRLRACGVAVEARRFAGAVHAFLSLPVDSQISRDCVGFVSAALRNSLLS